jgi:hypothetical protein
MRVYKANNGDDGCPWGVAVADERPFFGGPIRCGSLVNLSRSLCTHTQVASEACLRLDPVVYKNVRDQEVVTQVSARFCISYTQGETS